MEVVSVLLAALVGACAGAATVAAVVARMRRSAPPERVAPASERDVSLAAAVVPAPDRLQEAVDHLESAVVIFDADGRVQFRNRSARATDGTHAGVLIDDHVAATARDARIGEPGATARRVVDLQGPPKQWFEFNAYRLPDGGAVVTVRDVSERMRIEAMRTDFVSNVSHELKTPVGALAVLADALVDEHDPVVIDRLVARLIAEAQRATHTIDDLLELSQIESTRPADAQVDLTAVVRRAIARGQAIDGGRGVHIHALESSVPLLVRGDERQLESAVGNLVENAVKYSHDEGTVQVRTRVHENAVEVMVADQGIGIPSRDLGRVFERFYRVDRARSRATGGTGLGLAIVHHVATNHGGNVAVSSQEGEGSTFVLRLPADLLVTPEVETTA